MSWALCDYERFEYKTVLITGGTGSVGQPLTEKLLTKCPSIKKIIIYSRGENKQYKMMNSPICKQHADKLVFVIGDVTDKQRLNFVFDSYDVDYVIHAAAMRNVCMCEANPNQAVQINVGGAQNVIDCAIAHKVEQVVNLSTDKAVNPSCVYGTTKLLVEQLFNVANDRVDNQKDQYSIWTKFCSVRFGNVAGADGSVIPLFKQLIADGAKQLPIRGNNTTRFWMNVDDAIDLIVYAFTQWSTRVVIAKDLTSFYVRDLVAAIDPTVDIIEQPLLSYEKTHEVLIDETDCYSCERHGNDHEGYYYSLFRSSSTDDRNFVNPVVLSSQNAKKLTVRELQRLIAKL